MHKITLFIFCIFLFSACKPDTNSNASATAKRYPIKGKVVSADRTSKKAKIDHEKIEGYMEAMTMDFPIHADWVWDDLKPGSEIRAELVVDNVGKDPYYLENIGIIAAADPNQPAPPVNENFAQIGQSVPDFALTNQDGKRVAINDFKGKALAITFIYARCPLPDYCIKMSTAFSDTAKLIAANEELTDKVRLLSISFDPANDTPEKLRSYGIGYLGNDPKAKFDVWQLAVGKDAEVKKIADFFGLRYEVDQNDKTQINHSLRTAVIGPDGKVTKILPGNEWTVADLKNELELALKARQQ
ncbi:MAG TPA: SCO family protein [Pyrinomonadaceae bacterium]|nr:SCO family protein [Pyrinomonadaceae bacterium]